MPIKRFRPNLYTLCALKYDHKFTNKNINNNQLAVITVGLYIQLGVKLEQALAHNAT